MLKFGVCNIGITSEYFRILFRFSSDIPVVPLTNGIFASTAADNAFSVDSGSEKSIKTSLLCAKLVKSDCLDSLQVPPDNSKFSLFSTILAKIDPTFPVIPIRPIFMGDATELQFFMALETSLIMIMKIIISEEEGS